MDNAYVKLIIDTTGSRPQVGLWPVTRDPISETRLNTDEREQLNHIYVELSIILKIYWK